MAATAVALSSSSEVGSDGPVLNLINKRLRALRKKLNRISQMEESVSQGKTLNKEQEETLRSKPSVLAGIDELEKLRQPLSQAVNQEIQLALEKNKQSPETATEERTEEEGTVEPGADGEKDGVSAVSDLLSLVYFGSIFDVKTLMRAQDNMLTRTHERNCCLTYDYVTDDDAAGDPLQEWDLDLIAMLGSLLISRPVNSSLSHKNALQTCAEHAKLWLAKSEQPIDPNLNITCMRTFQLLSNLAILLVLILNTCICSRKAWFEKCCYYEVLQNALTSFYSVISLVNFEIRIIVYLFLLMGTILDAGLREKLDKIMASDYFTTTPEIKAPVEVAAAVGNYTSFQVPVHASVIPQDNFTLPVEGSAAEYEQETISDDECFIMTMMAGSLHDWTEITLFLMLFLDTTCDVLASVTGFTVLFTCNFELLGDSIYLSLVHAWQSFGFKPLEEESPNSNGNEMYGDETGPFEEPHQVGGSEGENVSELQAQAEPGIPDTEEDQNSRDVDLKEQQHTTRRSHQNYRGGRSGGGGGRRGYSNGRGGRGTTRGGYQNGRSQFYDQPGSYYPRNNYRGRGGRGMGGNYSYHASSSNAGNVQMAS
ncbi:hypothetical protein Sango_1032600 [Sesamum angolense]|uniref:Glycine-rich protein n=1 Tax=Sesamum angolense TaxID=2727404 RepID=A0AAE2BZ01_9LAMI|nr:hypothetical protein Sango_1032600 [Sesamum angolense]